jgi:Flp pilus assembly protein TadG
MRTQNPISKQKAFALCRVVRDLMVGADATAGVAVVEFALLVPVLAVMLIYIVDLGFYIYRYMEVQHAAQAGAQYASENPSSSLNPFSSITTHICLTVHGDSAFASCPSAQQPSQFYACVTASGTLSTVASPTTTCSYDNSTAGTYVKVWAQGTYNTLIPGLYGFASSYTVNSSATVRTQ